MSWGLQTYDEAGNIKLTQDKQLCRLIWSHVASAGVGGSATVSVAGFNNAHVVSIPLDGDEFNRHLPHGVSFNRSTGAISWWPQNIPIDSRLSAHAQFVSATSLIQVFAYG